MSPVTSPSPWRTRIPLVLWTCLLGLAITLPWSDLQDHAHWGRVRWFPTSAAQLNLRDIIANVLIFLPFGYLAAAEALHRRAHRPVWVVVGLAAVFSLGAEVTQLFNHSRYPSLIDVACNATGAWLGLRLRLRRRR